MFLLPDNRFASDTVLPFQEQLGDDTSLCIVVRTISGRRSHACSVEPPHPTEPPNAVKRSGRKYHSGVTRDWLFRCQGKELLLPLTYNGQKKWKIQVESARQKIIYYLMVLAEK
jgi:hypothetical protein